MASSQNQNASGTENSFFVSTIQDPCSAKGLTHNQGGSSTAVNLTKLALTGTPRGQPCLES